MAELKRISVYIHSHSLRAYCLQTLKQAAIAKDDMRLVVIGVGDHVDMSELEQIASDKTDVHYASSFKDLPQLAETVVETMCNSGCPVSSLLP